MTERGGTKLTVNVKPLDVALSGVGLMTLTSTVPAFEMSVAVMAAVNCVVFTKLVSRSEPSHSTLEPEMKFEPVTLSVNGWPPSGALEG